MSGQRAAGIFRPDEVTTFRRCDDFLWTIRCWLHFFNNRAEEAIGNATDLWAAYREGAFKPSQRPWLGYLMLLEECKSSTRTVRSWEPYFRVFPEFRSASYMQRYQLLLTKLVRERLYDGACFLLSDREGGAAGAYREPDPELSFQSFIQSLIGRAVAISGTK